MFVSHIYVLPRSDDESIGSSIPCIILTDSEAEDATFPVAPAPLSLDYVSASPDCTLNFDSDSKPFKEDPQEADLEESSEEDPSEDDSSDEDLIETDEPLQAQTALTPFVHPPPTRLLPIIFALVLRPGHEIPLRRPYSCTTSQEGQPLEASPSTPSSPPPSPLPSPSCKRSRPPSPPLPPIPSPPLIPLSSSPPLHMFQPHKRFLMTPLQEEATEETPTETIAPTRLCKKIMPTTRQGMNSAAIEQLITQLVVDAITAYEANRASRNGTHNEASRSAGGVEHTKMELVFHISNYAENCQGTDIVGYTRRFQELALLCPTMVTSECKMIERTPTPTATQRPLVSNQRTPVTYLECGLQGHYRNACPKLKNLNRGNQGSNGRNRGNGGARGRAFVLSGGEAV
ncbi:hypothetical protein Tco_0737088 [Tanacetum coccineum]